MQTPAQLRDAAATLKAAIIGRVRQARGRVPMHPVEQREYHFLCMGTAEALRTWKQGLAGIVSEQQIEQSRQLKDAKDNLAAIPCYIDDANQASLRAEYYGSLRNCDIERLNSVAGDNPQYHVATS
jgi:hypothetical protein